jgi:TP901 family phage tail tape measure protein
VAGAESFTVLAILEARDAASEIFAKVDESLGKFSETAKEAADTARGAGDSIDDSLLKTASGADALDLATARVGAAQEKATRTAEAQADAERGLVEAHKAAAGAEDDDVAAQYRLMEANQKLTAASKENAAAQKVLSDAQKTQSDTAVAAAAKNDEAAAGAVAVSDASKKGGLNLATMGRVAGVAALGMGVAGALMVKAAGNFQDSTVHLVTDAGESAKNLGMVQAGILKVSSATGQSAAAITNAMYHVESSGFHGAQGLAVLKVAAEGARVGGADLDTTSKALMGTLTAYYGTQLTAGQATKYSTELMNELIATVGSGDMRMQDLASSLHSVTAVAASAHIPFAAVGGAIATMTAQGMSASQATLDLGHMIGSLANPTNVQSQEMRALGLNANTVSKNIGKTGLAGTLNELRDAVLKNTSGGSVMLGYLKDMSPAAQGLANQITAGTISTGALTQAVKGLNPEQARLITQFKNAATSATGLKQTYTAAMAKMLGGQMGLNVGLMLTNTHMADTTKNTAAVAAAARKASGDVAGWSKIQGTFNFKVAQAKTAVENTGIAIGSALLPAATALFSAIGKILVPIAGWTAKHQKLTEILFVGVTALAATVAAVALASKAFKAVKGAVDDVSSAVKGGIAVLQKMGILSKQTAGTQSADAKSAAAAQEQASADSAAAADTAAGEQETASGDAAAAAEADAGETAAANETAAASTSAGWITAAASTVAGWAVAGGRMVVQAATWVAQSVAKVAVVVASNVAGAAVTMAAWIVANAMMLLGIGLIVIAVIAAVLLIVKYWKDIEKAAVAVWDAIVAGAKAAWNGITGFVRAIWDDITKDIQAAHALIMKIVTAAWIFVRSLISREISNVRTILGWFGKLGSLFRGWWHDATSAVTTEAGKLVSFVESIPGRILSGLSRLGSMLFNAGKSAISMLISGLKSIPVIGTMVSIGQDIVDHLPHSPAKKGPLSGSGSPDVAGRNITRMLASGMLAGTGDVAAASRQLASSVGLGRGGSLTAGIGSSPALSATASAGSGGGTTINVTIDLKNAVVASPASMNALTQEVGKQIVKQLTSAGYKSKLT